MALAPSSTRYVIPEPTRKIQITVSEKQYRRLLMRARLLGISMAEVVRRALDRELAADERAAKHGIQLAVVIRTLPRVLRQIHPRLRD
jgi:hypothetical protein